MIEKKTLGAFLAALRKANGLTQKDLAEKLNVSDKSVSRWERDEGMPDLSLIPVIAEIFGVTSDELLRGQRQPTNEPAANGEPTRTDKQRRRVLAASLTRYRTRSYLAAGVSMLGLLAALLCNTAFHRSYLGFYLCAACCLAAAVLQLISLNTAYLAVSDGEFVGEERGAFQRSLVRITQRVLGLALVLLAITLPLLVLGGPDHGLSDFWEYSLIYGLSALLLAALICYCIKHVLFQREEYAVNEKDSARYRHDHRLQGRCALLWLGLLLVTFCGHAISTNGWDVIRTAQGTVFTDFDSFVEFMEQDISYDGRTYRQNSLSPTPDSAIGDIHYYDQNGNEISEEEARRQTITDQDGNLLCTFIHRNQEIQNWRTGRSDQGYLPITAISYSQFWAAQQKINTLNTVFCILYLLETGAVLLLYSRQRAK